MTAQKRRFASELDLRDASDDFKARFWSKVDRRGPEECWPWNAYRKPSGYGQFTLYKGFFITASRVALALELGVLGEGIVARHDCDNPPCCNPRHLRAGTQSDNALDSVKRGRANRATGEDTRSAKLTEQDVREIRATPQYHGVNSALAHTYGVSSTTIKTIRRYQKWRHVA